MSLIKFNYEINLRKQVNGMPKSLGLYDSSTRLITMGNPSFKKQLQMKNISLLDEKNYRYINPINNILTN